jgi:aspartyl protease family protein
VDGVAYARWIGFGVTAVISAILGALLVLAIAPQPLRAARLEALGFSPFSASGQSAAILKGADGHFWAQAEVNGAPIRFLVDTGATAVALTPDDAERLGLDVRDLKYGQRVTTATGRSRAAAVTLETLSVGEARLQNVSALVIEDGLDTSLLGMSYLGRLSGFEATRETLFLRP